MISSPYKEYANVINRVYFGAQISHFLFILEHYGISAIVASTLIVMGQGILLFYLIYKRKIETFKSICWLGQGYSLFLPVVLVLQLFNIKDLIEWVYVYKVSLFMSSVTVLWVVLSEMRSNSNLRVFLAAIIVMVVSAVDDMMRYEIYPQERAATYTQ